MRPIDQNHLHVSITDLKGASPDSYIWVMDELAEIDTLQQIIINDHFLHEFTCVDENQVQTINKYESIVEIYTENKKRKREVFKIKI